MKKIEFKFPVLKKKLFTKPTALPPYFLPVITWALFAILVGHAIFSHLQIMDIQKSAYSTSQELADIRKTLDEEKERLQKLRHKVATLPQAADQKEDIRNLKSQVQSLGLQIDKLTSDIQSLGNFIIEKTDTRSINKAQTPLPFSNFEGHEWERELANFRKDSAQALVMRKSIHGGPEHDTLDEPEASDIYINGVAYTGFETFNTLNKELNTITILAPGLVNLKNDTLTIIADKGLDQVALDGCLTWSRSHQDKELDKWLATDIKGITKTVIITAGVNVTAQKSCDHRYLLRYKADILRGQISVNKNAYTPQAQPYTYAGIGLIFDKNLDTSNGMEVLKVIPSTPADQAGLKAQDRIIKVNRRPVSLLGKEITITFMRGMTGSDVELTYIPYGESVEKTITLKRERIVAPPEERKTFSAEGLMWDDTKNLNTRFVINRHKGDAASLEKTFYMINTGQGRAKLSNLSVSDAFRRPIKGWEISPRSTCSSGYTLPGEKCSVTVKVQPETDGEVFGFIHILDQYIPGGPTISKGMPLDLTLTGYARGIAGKLPDHVLGNGDACPQPGAKAEIATSEGNGFFIEDKDSTSKILKTVVCPDWKQEPDIHQGAYMVCVMATRPGRESSLFMKYNSSSINGPWKASSARERGLTSKLFCKDGIIDRIEVSWSPTTDLIDKSPWDD